MNGQEIANFCQTTTGNEEHMKKQALKPVK